MDKKILFCFALILCSVFLIGIASANTMCYQEDADTSNQTGIDGDCGLAYTGLHSTANTGDIGFFYINYTKPLGALPSSIWRMKLFGLTSPPMIGMWNITIPESCFNYNANKLELRFVQRLKPAENIGFVYGTCYDGAWQNITSYWNNTATGSGANVLSGQLWDGNWVTYGFNNDGGWRKDTGEGTDVLRIYEEAMIWDMPTQIDSCQDLSVAGDYILNQSVDGAGSCFTISASDIILDCNGYEITGDGTGIGIDIQADGSTVKNCIINVGNYQYGINIDGFSNNLLTGNNVTVDFSSEYGIQLSNSNSNTLSGNNVSGVMAIYLLDGSSYNVIIGNYVDGSATGSAITLETDTSYNNITDNTAIGNAGIDLVGSSNNIITNNVAYGIDGYGIGVNSADYNIFTGNNVTLTGAGSEAGIVIQSSDNNVFTDNIVISETYGIWLNQPSDYNIFTDNIITISGEDYRVSFPSGSDYNTLTDTANCDGVLDEGTGNVLNCGNVYLTSGYTYRQVDAGLLSVITGNVAGLQGATTFFPTFIVLASLVVLVVLAIIIINSVRSSGITQEGA